MMKKILSALMALTLLFSICSPVFSVSAKNAPAKDSKKTVMYMPENFKKHESKKIAGSQTNATPQSEYMLETGPFSSAPQPYLSNSFDVWKYENPITTVTYLEVTFSAATKTEKNCDFISIFDADENLVGVYSGDQLSGKTIKVLGNSFYLVLETDKYSNFHGFDVTAINGVSSPTVSGIFGVNLNWAFTFSTGVLAITGSGAMDNFVYDDNTYDCNTPWRWFNASILGVTIDNGVTSIGDYAFSDCYALTSITFGTGVKAIGDYAFAWNWSLKTLNIPGTIESIGKYAFVDCEALVSLTIGAGVKTIGDFAFAACIMLPSVVIPASVTGIGAGTFASCFMLTKITVADTNANYLDLDGILLSKDKKILVQYPIGFFQEYDSFYIVPDSVTSIGDYAFAGSSLRYVILSKNLTLIGAYAFAGCNLSTINIGSKVTEIKEGAFIENMNMNSANFSGNAPTMENYVFDGCGYGYLDFDFGGSDFTVYYFAGKTGFTDPWHTYHTESMEPYIHIIDFMDFNLRHKLGPWDFYRNVTSHLVMDTNLDIASVAWKSDSKKVLINEFGSISNKGVGARKANITLTVTDADGVKYSQTVKVVFYKYDWQLKNLLK